MWPGSSILDMTLWKTNIWKTIDPLSLLIFAPAIKPYTGVVTKTAAT
jgi:hypothetical protein